MPDGQASRVENSLRPQLDCPLRFRQLEDGHESLMSFRGKPLSVPEAQQGVGKPQAPVGVATLDEPVQRRPKVVLLQDKSLEPTPLFGAPELARTVLR